jgi:hypothetical protein
MKLLFGLLLAHQRLYPAKPGSSKENYLSFLECLAPVFVAMQTTIDEMPSSCQRTRLIASVDLDHSILLSLLFIVAMISKAKTALVCALVNLFLYILKV